MGHGLTRQSRPDLLIDDDADLDTPVGGGLEHIVKAILLIAGRGPAQVELGAQPPIEDVDALPGLCRSIRQIDTPRGR